MALKVVAGDFNPTILKLYKIIEVNSCHYPTKKQVKYKSKIKNRKTNKKI